jgi:hypothetical protein
MEGTAQVACISQAPDLRAVASRPLEGHEAQAPRVVEPGEPSRDPRADRAAGIVEDRQAIPAHDARRRVGCT